MASPIYSQPLGLILQLKNSRVLTHWNSLIYSHSYLMARSESEQFQKRNASTNLHSLFRRAVVSPQI